MNNKQIVNKAGTITTSSVTSGLLQPEQAKMFLQQCFDSTEIGKHIRHEIRRARKGEIDKIGIASRILRKKTENSDDGYRANVNTSSVPYSTEAVRTPWEISEETLRENIEGESLDKIITDLMTTQIGIDLIDLAFNGDEDVSAEDADHDFLYIDNGFIKQIKNGGHIHDATGEAEMNLKMFYQLLQTIPNKYNNGNLRWLMSPQRAQQWEEYLLEKVIDAGGAVPEGVYNAPAKIPTITVPQMSNNIILLTDPKNLITVHTYNLKIRKTTEGKEAIMEDKRFYNAHYDQDAIIEEIDATGAILL